MSRRVSNLYFAILNSQKDELVGERGQNSRVVRAGRDGSIRVEPGRNVLSHAFGLAKSFCGSDSYERRLVAVSLDLPSDCHAEEHGDGHFQDGQAVLLRLGRQ